MIKEELRKEWADKVEEFIASGQSQSAWCRAQNIDKRKFNYWFSRYKKAHPKENNFTNWLPVKINALEEKSKTATLLLNVGFATVEVKTGFDQELLLDILKTLKVLC